MNAPDDSGRWLIESAANQTAMGEEISLHQFTPADIAEFETRLARETGILGGGFDAGALHAHLQTGIVRKDCLGYLMETVSPGSPECSNSSVSSADTQSAL